MDSIVSSVPRITVLMPVYNCELYINEAIDSILNQTYSNFELLIIDDASTDSTVEKIKQYTDSRINLIVKPKNSGYTNSLNLGIKIAKGKYIARMDGDDISVLDRFEKQVQFLENNEKVILCGGWFRILDSGKVIELPENHDAIKLKFLVGNCIAHPSVMIRKKTLEDLDVVYDVTKEPAEDYDLWTRLAFKGELHNLQEVLLNYRVHFNQVSSKKGILQKHIDTEIKRNLFDKLVFDFSIQEAVVFNKILNNGEGIEYGDFSVFKKVQTKLLASNINGDFESLGFIKEIMYLDKIFVKSCFLKANAFNPTSYINYLKIKPKSSYKLTRKDEFKLVIKGLFFFKIKTIK